MKQKYIGVLFLLVIVTSLLIGLIWYALSIDNIRDPEAWRAASQAYPVLTPVLLIGLMIAEVVIAPLPGGFLPVITGFLFGPILGVLYSWLGNVLGSYLSFFLARTFGRSLVQLIVKPETLTFYDHFLIKKQKLLWIVYVVPFFPIDLVSISVGLSKISFKKFAPIVGFGLLPGMILFNALGNALYDSAITSLIISAGLLFILFIIYWYRKEWLKA